MIGKFGIKGGKVVDRVKAIPENLKRDFETFRVSGLRAAIAEGLDRFAYENRKLIGGR